MDNFDSKKIVGVLVTRIPGGKSLRPMTETDVAVKVRQMEKGRRVRVLGPSRVLMTIEDARTQGIPFAAIGGWVANSYGACRSLRVVALPDGSFALGDAGCTCPHGSRARVWEMKAGDAHRVVSHG